MANKIEARLPRGMRDILPQKMIQRRYVVGVMEEVFESFGFEPLQTPALELAETLMGKYGPDAEKLIYDARHREGKETLALRYDLTVPLSRVTAMYPELVKPFKRYQIAPLWRAERPQKGRYREFYQCDVDIVGSSSMLADAEIIALTYTVLSRLGFKQFETRVNNRKILAAIGEYAGVPSELRGGLYRAIDKLDKIGPEGVREELEKNEIPPAAARQLIDLIAIPGDDLEAVRARLTGFPAAAPLANEGIDELEELSRYLPEMGVGSKNVKIDFTMVRGLEYYTGPIYETIVTEPKIGSLTGGGRYDKLTGLFSGKYVPTTGTSLGLERIIDVMEELEMFPPEVGRTVTQVLVTVFDAERRPDSIRLARQLRDIGYNTEVWLDVGGLGKQLKYAAAKGIPFAVIVGPDEAAEGAATLRDLTSGEQVQVKQEELAEELGRRVGP